MTEAVERDQPDYEALLALISRKDEMVPAAAIAPILRMKPERIVGYAKAGQWPREICNYIVSGRNGKFFRIDFLRKGGWI